MEDELTQDEGSTGTVDPYEPPDSEVSDDTQDRASDVNREEPTVSDALRKLESVVEAFVGPIGAVWVGALGLVGLCLVAITGLMASSISIFREPGWLLNGMLVLIWGGFLSMWLGLTYPLRRAVVHRENSSFGFADYMGNLARRLGRVAVGTILLLVAIMVTILLAAPFFLMTGVGIGSTLLQELFSFVFVIHAAPFVYLWFGTERPVMAVVRRTPRVFIEHTAVIAGSFGVVFLPLALLQTLAGRVASSSYLLNLAVTLGAGFIYVLGIWFLTIAVFSTIEETAGL